MFSAHHQKIVFGSVVSPGCYRRGPYLAENLNTEVGFIRIHLRERKLHLPQGFKETVLLRTRSIDRRPKATTRSPYLIARVTLYVQSPALYSSCISERVGDDIDTVR